jgi:5-methylcytosine-specific restriction endonuclease McrA
MENTTAVIIPLVFWGGVIAIYLLDKIVKKRKQAAEHRQHEQKHLQWLHEDEPQYRSLHTYPPDWPSRKLYIHRLYGFTCQECGASTYLNQADQLKAQSTRHHTLRTGLHVHHIKPLSKGGDNSLDNLTLLCEQCHQNQHPHMLKKLLVEYKLKAARARSSERKQQWIRLYNQTLERLEKAERVK